MKTKKLTIFISRNLSEDSIFHRLDKSKFRIIDQSLLSIATIAIKAFPPSDWIFFYSKNGVIHYFRNLKKADQKPPSYQKYACMGSGTQDQLISEIGRKANFVGVGKPPMVAENFMAKIDQQSKVLFITAKNSMHSIEKLIEGSVKYQSIAVYDNQIKKEYDIPTPQIIIFTSPKNSQAYLQKYKIKPEQKIICIGKTTALKTHRLGVQEVIIPPYPSEEAIYQTLSRIL